MNNGNWKSCVIAEKATELLLTSGYRNLEIRNTY